MANFEEVKSCKDEVHEALKHFSTPELLVLKQEIKDKLARDVHYNATSEIKRYR